MFIFHLILYFPQLKIDVEFKNMEERDRVANVKIKKVSVIDISWIRRIRPGFWRNDLSYMTSIQAIDVILKAAALGNGVVPVRMMFSKFDLTFTNSKMFAIFDRSGDQFFPNINRTKFQLAKVPNFG